MTTAAQPGGCDREFAPGWHTFASDWRPGSVTYYYDGRRVGIVSAGVTGQPMYVLIDNSVRPRAANVTSRGLDARAVCTHLATRLTLPDRSGPSM